MSCNNTSRAFNEFMHKFNCYLGMHTLYVVINSIDYGVTHFENTYMHIRTVTEVVYCVVL